MNATRYYVDSWFLPWSGSGKVTPQNLEEPQNHLWSCWLRELAQLAAVSVVLIGKAASFWLVATCCDVLAPTLAARLPRVLAACPLLRAGERHEDRRQADDRRPERRWARPLLAESVRCSYAADIFFLKRGAV